MILIEFLAETEPGAVIGIVVCTADHSVETFLPAYVSQNCLPTSAGPIPPSSLAPWQLAQVFWYALAPFAACALVYQPAEFGALRGNANTVTDKNVAGNISN